MLHYDSFTRAMTMTVSPGDDTFTLVEVDVYTSKQGHLDGGSAKNYHQLSVAAAVQHLRCLVFFFGLLVS